MIITSRLALSPLDRESFALSSNQMRVDSALNGFTTSASDSILLASMTLGSLTFKLSKMAFLSSATSIGLNRAPRFLINGAANLFAVTSEVAAFRSSNNFLGSLAGHQAQQGALDPYGFAGTLTDFIALKSIGHLGANSSTALTHFAQANAMVLGHEASAILGFTAHQDGSYIEKLFNAEAMNIALGAGNGVLGIFTGGRIRRFENSIEIKTPHSLRTISSPQSILRSANQNAFEAHDRAIAKRLDQIAEPACRPLNQQPIDRSRAVAKNFHVGILTSGGDGPGENAAIEALVRGVLQTYAPFSWRVSGIWDGFRGLLEPEGRIHPLSMKDVKGKAATTRLLEIIHGFKPEGASHESIATIGGSLLRSSRTNPVQNDPQALRVKQSMQNHGIDALIVLGGNGSMGASRDLAEQGVRLVVLPQSIDNDAPGTDVSIGFPSAVAQGTRAILELQQTAHSFERWFIVEVMGQHSGALALAMARKARVQGLFLGENPRPFSEIKSLIEGHIQKGRRHGVILVSEGVQFSDEVSLATPPPREKGSDGRLIVKSGQMAAWVSHQLSGFDTRPESLAYLLRGANPTPPEIRLAQAFAEGALQLLAAEQYGMSVGMRWSSEGFWRRNHRPLGELKGLKHAVCEEEVRLVRRELGLPQ